MEARRTLNGVAVEELGRTAEMLRDAPDLALFRFQIRNKWIEGGHNRTIINQFHGVGEDIPHEREFLVEADEPAMLLGRDAGANPVEHLLNALAACLTTSMVYHAAARGIRIEELESWVEGDLDLRGFMGLAPHVRKGYQNIRVHFRVKSDAPVEALEECARFSPVFDTLTHGTDVSLDIRKG